MWLYVFIPKWEGRRSGADAGEARGEYAELLQAMILRMKKTKNKRRGEKISKTFKKQKNKTSMQS
jgi:hypothetical protein